MRLQSIYRRQGVDVFGLFSRIDLNRWVSGAAIPESPEAVRRPAKRIKTASKPRKVPRESRLLSAFPVFQVPTGTSVTLGTNALFRTTKKASVQYTTPQGNAFFTVENPFPTTAKIFIHLMDGASIDGQVMESTLTFSASAVLEQLVYGDAVFGHQLV